MAQKKTYIYRMTIGKHGDIYEDVFLYARNATVATDFCKQYFKDKKYDLFRANKVGLSHVLRETEIIKGYSAEKLRNSIAAKDEKFSEREVTVPQFVSPDEMEELSP